MSIIHVEPLALKRMFKQKGLSGARSYIIIQPIRSGLGIMLAIFRSRIFYQDQNLNGMFEDSYYLQRFFCLSLSRIEIANLYPFAQLLPQPSN